MDRTVGSASTHVPPHRRRARGPGARAQPVAGVFRRDRRRAEGGPAMAESDLIDGYLADLRRQIRWRGDVDDVIDEVEDHLRETAANLSAAGVDEREAQRRTLVRFGDPAIIHRVFSTSPSGGVVMPTAFTRTAGAVAFLAAPLWIAAAVLKWWESGLFAPWSHDRFVAYSVVAASATLLALIVMLGMLARVGWPRPTSGVAIGLALLGLIGMAGVTWM